MKRETRMVVKLQWRVKCSELVSRSAQRETVLRGYPQDQDTLMDRGVGRPDLSLSSVIGRLKRL